MVKLQLLLNRNLKKLYIQGNTIKKALIGLSFILLTFISIPPEQAMADFFPLDAGNWWSMEVENNPGYGEKLTVIGKVLIGGTIADLIEIEDSEPDDTNLTASPL